MQPTSLRYFLAVAAGGSLSHAAEHLHVAVSALSRQIARLEDEFGTPLFERRARGMVLTEAGQIFAAYVRRTSLEADRVAAEIRGLSTLASTTVRVASSEGAASDFLPDFFVQFQQAYPGMRFHLTVTASDEATRLVRDGIVDIGITFARAPEKGVRVDYSERAPVYALMNADHPLAGRKKLALADLRHQRLALMDQGTTIRQLFDICCAMNGLLFEPVFVSDFSAALYAFAHQANVITLTGYLTVRNRIIRDKLVAVPISDPEMHQRSIQVQTMAGRTLPTAVSTFLEHLIHAIRGASRPPPASNARRRRGATGDGNAAGPLLIPG